MGCGSSRSSTIGMAVYQEQSEFDTCSTVVLPKDSRGEPDGQEVPLKESINEYTNSKSNQTIVAKAWTQQKTKKTKEKDRSAKKSKGVKAKKTEFTTLANNSKTRNLPSQSDKQPQGHQLANEGDLIS